MNIYRSTITLKYNNNGVDLISQPIYQSVIGKDVEDAISKLKENYKELVSIHEVKLEYRGVDEAIGWEVK